MLREYHIGHIVFYYEDVTIGSRNSIQEFNKDVNIRNLIFNNLVGDVLLDVGAGFGSYTLTALANAAGFVYAFERDSKIASVLRHNLHSNHNIHAGEKVSVCRWNLDDSTNTIDRYLSELSSPVSRVDWIKIDLGSIPDNRVVMWGARDTIRNHKPSILIADPEPPKISFLDEYRIADVIDSHSLLIHRFR